jgi:uncharacterized phage protein gp47/JayE
VPKVPEVIVPTVDAIDITTQVFISINTHINTSYNSPNIEGDITTLTNLTY